MVARKSPAPPTQKKPQAIRMIRCPNPRCGYVWTPKVKHPKSCPECKTRLGWYNRKKGSD